MIIKKIAKELTRFAKKVCPVLKKETSEEQIYYKKSYSQVGEDIIVSYLLNKHKDIYYLDIGANHPSILNNTYYFYKQGYQGILVEPDITLIENLKAVRPRDLCLNMGVSFDEKESADFYVMEPNVLNTFSKKEALGYEKIDGYKIKDVKKVKLIKINDLLENYCKRCPDFVSLDVEGLDLQILQSWNFKKYRPFIFCVETISYTKNGSVKQYDEINYLKENGYAVFADTFINTIFIDKTQNKSNFVF